MDKKKLFFRMAMLLFAVGLLFGMSAGAEAKAKKKVKKTSLSKAKITLSKTKYTYNGKAKKPKVTVKIGKKKISKKKNYTVTYSKNKNTGKAKVTIKAKKKSKKYKGKKTKKFTIQKASRTLTAGRAEYTAIEGDGNFNLTAKASKGDGVIKYSCPTSNVVKVADNGTVSVVGKGTAVVNISIPETKNYKAAATTTKVTISKKTITVDSYAGVKNFDYATQIKKVKDKEGYTCPVNKLTDFSWSIVTKYAIPGLAPTADDDLTNKYIECNNLCPQGFCYAGDYLLTTAYCMDDVHKSCIFIYNKASGAYLKTIVLEDKSHVGGITYDAKNNCVWICHAGSKRLQKITYSDIKKYAAGTKGMVKIVERVLHDIPAKPSSVTYNANDGYLWVAEYVSVPDNKKGEEAYMYPYKYENDKLMPVTRTVYEETTMERGYLGVETKEVKAGETEDPSEPENPSEPEGLSEQEDTEGDSGEETDTDMTVLPVSGAAVTTVVKVKEIKDAVVEKIPPEDENPGGSTDSEQDEPGAGSEEEDKPEEGENPEKEKYQIAIGDVITKLSGKKIETKKDLDAALVTLKGKKKASITLIRYLDADRQSALKISGDIELGVYESEEEMPPRLLPNRVQGLVFTEDGSKLILSRSVGRNTEKTNYMSQIEIYKWDIEEDELPKPTQVVVLPPMVEQIQVMGNSVYLLFESAATTYLEGTDGNGKSESAIDKLVTVKLDLK